jgi:hypothetical protein
MIQPLLFLEGFYLTVRLVLLTVAQVNEVIRLAEIKAVMIGRNISDKRFGAWIIPPLGQEQLQLTNLIQQLSGVAKCELTALMWVGQGRIGNDSSRWKKLFRAALEELINDLPDHLASNGSLHHDLRRGLEIIGRVGGLTPSPLS